MFFNRPEIHHYVIEIFRPEQNINDNRDIEDLVESFVKKINLTIVKTVEHDFTPYGATKLFILSSSHLAVHTWPENEYMHLDLLVCSEISEESISRASEEIFSGIVSVKQITPYETGTLILHGLDS